MQSQSNMEEARPYHGRSDIYQVPMDDWAGTLVIERVYDAGGIIPHSELFCCGELDNVLNWRPHAIEAGYYKLDRGNGLIRLAATPAGQIMIQFHVIPLPH